MKIKKLIEAFELAIPTYQKAVDEKWDYQKITINRMEFGICCFLRTNYNIHIGTCFNKYYINYIYFNYIYIPFIFCKNINKSIKPRLQFMKKEVKDLKKLLKQGYTHV